MVSHNQHRRRLLLFFFITSKCYKPFEFNKIWNKWLTIKNLFQIIPISPQTIHTKPHRTTKRLNYKSPYLQCNNTKYTVRFCDAWSFCDIGGEKEWMVRSGVAMSNTKWFFMLNKWKCHIQKWMKIYKNRKTKN